MAFSCGVTFQNKQFIFGGMTGDTYRQVLQVDNCRLVSTGSIPFDLYHGACGSTDDARVSILAFLVNLQLLFRGESGKVKFGEGI